MLGLALAGLGLGVLKSAGWRNVGSGLLETAKFGRSKYGELPAFAKLGIAAGAIGTATYAGISPFSNYQDKKTLAIYGDNENTRQMISDKDSGRLMIAGAAGAIGAAVVGTGMGLSAISRRSAKKAASDSVASKGSSFGKKALNTLTARNAFGAFAYGGAAGALTIAGATSQDKQMYFGEEGRITGIQSSRGGGISPELQFSTQGLTLNLHNRSRRVY